MGDHKHRPEQNPVLFEGSIIDNIRKGNESLSYEALQEWCDSTGVCKVFCASGKAFSKPLSWVITSTVRPSPLCKVLATCL